MGNVQSLSMLLHKMSWILIIILQNPVFMAQIKSIFLITPFLLWIFFRPILCFQSIKVYLLQLFHKEAVSRCSAVRAPLTAIYTKATNPN